MVVVQVLPHDLKHIVERTIGIRNRLAGVLGGVLLMFKRSADVFFVQPHVRLAHTHVCRSHCFAFVQQIEQHGRRVAVPGILIQRAPLCQRWPSKQRKQNKVDDCALEAAARCSNWEIHRSQRDIAPTGQRTFRTATTALAGIDSGKYSLIRGKNLFLERQPGFVSGLYSKYFTAPFTTNFTGLKFLSLRRSRNVATSVSIPYSRMKTRCSLAREGSRWRGYCSASKMADALAVLAAVFLLLYSNAVSQHSALQQAQGTNCEWCTGVSGETRKP